MRVALRLTCLLLPIAVGVGRGDSPADLVPADAKVVVLVTDVEKAINNWRDYVSSIGQNAPPVDTAQITQLLQELGTQWKVTRGAAVAVLEPSPQGVAVVFPVDDGAASLKKVAPDSTGNTGKFELGGQQVFGLAKGKYLVVSQGENTLKAFENPSKTLGASMTASQAKLAAESVDFIYFNIQALKPLLEGGLKNNEAIRATLERSLGNLKIMGQNVPVDRVLENLEKAVTQLSQETKAIFLAVNFTKDAASLRFGAEFLGSGKAARAVANYASGAGDLTSVLPAAPFVGALALDMDGAASLDERGRAKSIGVQQFGLAATYDKELLMGVGRLAATDAASLNEQAKGLIGGLLPLLLAGAAKDKATFTPNQTKVGGVDVQELTVGFNNIPDKSKTAIKALFGGSSLILQEGLVGNSVAFTLGGLPDGFTAAQNSSSLAGQERVKPTLALLPPKPLLLVLLDPMTAVRVGKKVAELNPDRPSPLKGKTIPAQAGVPLGFAVSVDKEGVIGHFVVPAASVKDVIPILSDVN